MEYVIRKENDREFTVIKWNDEPISSYTVNKNGKGKWYCNCPHAHYRHVRCKHTAMVIDCISKGAPQPFVIENF